MTAYNTDRITLSPAMVALVVLGGYRPPAWLPWAGLWRALRTAWGRMRG